MAIVEIAVALSNQLSELLRVVVNSLGGKGVLRRRVLVLVYVSVSMEFLRADGGVHLLHVVLVSSDVALQVGRLVASLEEFDSSVVTCCHWSLGDPGRFVDSVAHPSLFHSFE